MREGVPDSFVGAFGAVVGKVEVMGAELSSAAVMSNNSVPTWSERDPSDHSTMREFACGICRTTLVCDERAEMKD